MPAQSRRSIGSSRRASADGSLCELASRGGRLDGARAENSHGEVEILDDGNVRLHLNVRYPGGATLPFSEGATAGPDGHTLEFQRTFHQAGRDELRGVFRIKGGDRWEDPHPDFSPEGGYHWRRVQASEPPR